MFSLIHAFFRVTIIEIIVKQRWNVIVKKDSSIHFYIDDPNLHQIRILFAAVLSKYSFSRFHSFLKHKCPKCLRHDWNAHHACERWLSDPCMHENGSKEPGTLCFLALFHVLEEACLSTFGQNFNSVKAAGELITKWAMMQWCNPHTTYTAKQHFLLALRPTGRTTHKTTFRVKH